jgi:hypothetical protein
MILCLRTTTLALKLWVVTIVAPRTLPLFHLSHTPSGHHATQTFRLQIDSLFPSLPLSPPLPFSVTNDALLKPNFAR